MQDIVLTMFVRDSWMDAGNIMPLATTLAQVNFTRARGPGFDSWTDPSKIARPQDSHVVTCPAGGPGKTRLTRPSTPSSSMDLDE